MSVDSLPTVDLLVLGSGAAGVSAACAARAAGLSVRVVSKGPLTVGDTRISTGIIAAPEAHDSSAQDRFLADLEAAAGGLGSPALRAALATRSALALRWLHDGGLVHPTDETGELRRLPRPMGGHQDARSVPHPGRGLAIAAALADRIDAAPMHVMDDHPAVDVLMVDGRASGALLLDAKAGRWVIAPARWTVLATGGLCQLYAPHSDTMRDNTGDGVAMAARAGATLIDMEQVQFTPFGVVTPHSMAGLPLGEATLAGPLGVLRDHTGAVLAQRFSNASRADVAGWCARALADGKGSPEGGLWLDLAPNRQGPNGPAWWSAFKHNWGHVLRTVGRSQGSAAARLETPWLVAPTAHYHMGGVAVNTRARTDIEGLLAAGQVAGGVHGANRLGSCSLPTAVMLGLAAAHEAQRPAPEVSDADLRRAATRLLEDLPGVDDVHRRTADLQALAWTHLGPGRSGLGMAHAAMDMPRLRPSGEAAPLRPWPTDVLAALELRNLHVAANAILVSAQRRPGTRGAHLRLDAATETATGVSTRVWMRTDGSLKAHLGHRP